MAIAALRSRSASGVRPALDSRPSHECREFGRIGGLAFGEGNDRARECLLHGFAGCISGSERAEREELESGPQVLERFLGTADG